ncbi:hypothetical protein [Spartinivicinus ruber]|uniref:hypothetical protein n=1 Tax=Spartinivicinus ruber TaxID=2683272 RepID=UPI0013D0D643|nr:hypothetical protein [Spartinivicinus ruber]
MLTLEEQSELDLLDESAVCGENNILFLSYPLKEEISNSDIEVVKFIDTLEA